MKTHNCESCPIRAKYDKAPKSVVGRFWRWHINFCPGWKGYMRSLDDENRQMLKEKYHLEKL
ncbi:MAG: hypothetical protein LBV47_04420 [Bacteroidales bacterium]|nr:hypothetical protein [Bacteroidales bacterium]